MTQDFKTLKKTSGKQALENLSAQIEKLQTKSYADTDVDTRFWYPAVDKAGNGFAVIRFLPAIQGEDVPFVRLWDHGFQGPGGWYIELSRTTLGEKDPAAELNSKLWNQSTDDNSPGRKQARDQKRRLTYISNIYVIKDGANPENEGKVFLFKYGKKVFGKLQDAINPEFEGDVALDPFDFWEGANFKLKIRKFEGYRNYDKSEFDKPEPLADDDKLKEIWESQFSLNAEVAPEKFKSYSELEARLKKALGADSKGRTDPGEQAAVRQPRASAAKEIPSEDTVEDDDLAFFRNIAKDDNTLDNEIPY